MRITSIIMAATAGAFLLAACTPPEQYNPNDPNQRTREGAAVGAGLGALAGLITGDTAKERRNRALGGAIIGGIAGGVIGNNLDKQAAELAASFDNGAIGVINTGNELIVRMPQDVLFATDSAVVSSNLRGDLQTLAASLNRYPDTTVQVVGHTDNTGSAAYNQDLSERRAQSVAAILQGAGVAGYRLQAFGRGENEPIATNYSPEGRAQNRRVDIIIRPNA
jgi:outer membrane protein OmpA-like peptidoglycan-associated protein